ncbi:low affinity iron permease family protein [Paludisphaera soli]|uniref:low affinity iron permease family protein n=1 Tax=Paludisphaera soli TaxID=2712865 RepID=UPI001980AA95|nr:low affinity iron permease family protein [Paludisphaera soli]
MRPTASVRKPPFLIVFLIQNAQNRESKVLHLKLDELIVAAKRANNQFVDVEDLTEAQLDHLAGRYRMIGERYRGALEDQADEVEVQSDRVEGRIERVAREVEGGGPSRGRRRPPDPPVR